MRVTLMLMPSASAWLIAAKLPSVAGILMKRFGRSTIHHSDRASATVFAASAEMRGSTSIDTRPSTVSLAS